jgi:hypothetical protein
LTKTDFEQALQVAVTMPELAKSQAGFLSVAQYPRAFEPDDGEFGMIVVGDKIKERLFSHP